LLAAFEEGGGDSGGSSATAAVVARPAVAEVVAIWRIPVARLTLLSPSRTDACFELRSLASHFGLLMGSSLQVHLSILVLHFRTIGRLHR